MKSCENCNGEGFVCLNCECSIDCGCEDPDFTDCGECDGGGMIE